MHILDDFLFKFDYNDDDKKEKKIKTKEQASDVDVDKVLVVVDFKIKLLSLRMTRVNKLRDSAVDDDLKKFFTIFGYKTSSKVSARN